MASHYLHLILSHQTLANTHLADECRSAFLLGAIAPDAVTDRQDKVRTHFAIRVGTTWAYRFRAFERAFAGYRARSALHQRFYRGYRYHLILDDAWMRECLHRAVLRLAIKTLTGRANGGIGQYYDEMTQFNAFHRSSVAPGVLQDAFARLTRADLDLFPAFLERDAFDRILKHISGRMLHTASHFDGQLIRARDVKRFMDRVSEMRI